MRRIAASLRSVVWACLAICAGLSLAQRASAADVTISDRPQSVVLDNGIVSAEISKKSGDVLGVQYAGQSILAGPAYLDWNLDVRFTMDNVHFSVRTDPASNHGEMAEVMVLSKYQGQGIAFDIELHHVLRRGDSGMYTYAVFTHPADYPESGFGQSRMVYRVNEKLFDFINIDDERRFLMPPPGTPTQAMGPKESLLVTDGPFKGYMADKYHLFVDAGEHYVHGWTGTTSNLGCFVLDGSVEDHNGGPTKQHNTAHFPRVLLKLLTCGHYGAAGVKVGAESWQKIYGPWMLYLNKAQNNDALWADAKRKVQEARAAWPYAWMNHPAYPLAAQRGAVSGRIQIIDPQDPKASPANAWVGLAEPQPDWQQQSNGYQFWVRADRDGRFSIPNVRAGSYTLYAFVDGVMDEFRHDGVRIDKAQKLDLGDLEWKPMRFGQQLWQIGTPDRTAREFRHGDNYRVWGLSRLYPTEFPNDVNFIIGTSNERIDWNYAQVTVQKDGAWVGTTWNVLFDVKDPIKPGQATLRIAFAAAQNADLRVEVNGQPIGAIRDLGADSAMIRAGIHGQYHLRDLKFDSALLKSGQNRIALQQRAGGTPLKNVMYDCLRLEVPQ
jgi:rhamnogalacturonan endolyase